jgi:hypothetical protein
VRDETYPRVEAIIERAFDEVSPTLRPDQRDNLDRLRAHIRERMRRHHAAGPSDEADPSGAAGLSEPPGTSGS